MVNPERRLALTDLELGASPKSSKRTEPLLPLLLMCLALGCGPSRTDYNRIRQENLRLQAEMDSVKYGAARLYADAQGKFNRHEFVAAQEALSLLAQKHPESPQVESSKALARAVGAELEKEAKAQRQREAEQRKKAATPNWPYAGIRVKVMDSYGNISKGTVLDRPPIELDRVVVALDEGGTCEVRWVSLGSQLSESDFDKFGQALDKLRRQWDEK